MDKQETINHVFIKLQAGYTIEEIVGELSHIFNAPAGVIGRFVDKVISDNPENFEQSPIHPDIPDWLEPLPIPINTSTLALDPSSAYSDLPPGLQAILNNHNPNLVDSVTQPFDAIPTQELSKTSVSAFGHPVTRAVEEGDTDTSNVNLRILNETVLQQLKRGVGYSDIVEHVCDQTGWHWNKSQRFVAGVQTKNHDKLRSGKNRVIILIGIGVILIGFLLASNGVSLIYDFVKITSLVKTNPEVLLSSKPQSAIYALATMVTGIGMMIGGGFGIFQAFTKQ